MRPEASDKKDEPVVLADGAAETAAGADPGPDEPVARGLDVTPLSGGRRLGRWRLERRATPRGVVWYRLGALAIGCVVALAVAPAVGGGSSIYSTLWASTLGSSLGLGNVLMTAAPLLLATLAACVPYRLGLWNIGTDGQMFIGAWAAAGVAFSLSDLPAGALIPLMFVAAVLGGAAWMLGPALARAYLGVNEIVTTLLMNFVAVYWLVYWANGQWRASFSGGGIQSRMLPDQAQLSIVTIGNVDVQWGLFLGVGAALLAWSWFRASKMGFELSVVRASPGAARHGGIPVRRRMLQTMLIGGAMGGLAGAVEMMGDVHQYGQSISNNTGYIGIMVAVLAVGSELAAVPMTVLFAVLMVGGDALQVSGASSDIVVGLLGVILFLAAVGDTAARYRLVRGMPSSTTETRTSTEVMS